MHHLPSILAYTTCCQNKIMLPIGVSDGPLLDANLFDQQASIFVVIM
jgi:hypothetical protein